MKTYTAKQASAVQSSLLLDLIVSSLQLPAAGIDVLIAYSDERDPEPFLQQLPSQIKAFPQAGANIGLRMNNAINYAFKQGYQEVVLTGSDLPNLTAATIKTAFNKMREIVIGPSLDGGYYLIGCRRGVDISPLLTAKIDWGHRSVLHETLSRITKYDVQLLAPQVDIDFPQDLSQAAQHLDKHNRALRQWLSQEVL